MGGASGGEGRHCGLGGGRTLPASLVEVAEHSKQCDQEYHPYDGGYDDPVQFVVKGARSLSTGTAGHERVAWNIVSYL